MQDHIRNSEVAARTGLGPVSDLITRRWNSVFGHIARLSDTPFHQALRCRVDLTLGHLPDQSWKRRPGRPNNRWIDQLRRDNNNTPPADLWRRSTTRSFGSDATVLDDYALTTTTTMQRRERLCDSMSSVCPSVCDI